MHKYKITWRPNDGFGMPTGTEIVEASSVTIDDGRICFSAYDRSSGTPVRYVVLSARNEDVLAFSRVDEPEESSEPPKPEGLMYPENLALFRVKFRDPASDDELIWAEYASVDDSRPPLPMIAFYATLRTTAVTMVRAIWSDRIDEVSTVRYPASEGGGQ